MDVTSKNYAVGYDRMCIRKYNILKAFLNNTAFTALTAKYTKFNLEIN